MIEVNKFEDTDRDEVIALVLHCQNDGSRPLVSVEDQPELLCIREKYLENGGCFWVAKENGLVAGSIGLLNAGGGIGILKKFFVYEAYRSRPHHLGSRLYEELLAFARKHCFHTLILDTPKNTDRAHRFYEKAGFSKIDRDELPVMYDYPYEDSDFFLLKIQDDNAVLLIPEA